MDPLIIAILLVLVFCVFLQEAGVMLLLILLFVGSPDMWDTIQLKVKEYNVCQVKEQPKEEVKSDDK